MYFERLVNLLHATEKLRGESTFRELLLMEPVTEVRYQHANLDECDRTINGGGRYTVVKSYVLLNVP